VVIAVGSTRGPKLTAVRRVLAGLAPLHAELAAASVVPLDLGVVAPSMPLSLSDLLEGSRRRAVGALEAVQAAGGSVDLGIGLEGGLDVRSEADGARKGFLMSWAFVTDGRRGVHGCGGALEVPARLLDEVVDRGTELSAAIDAWSGESDVRSRQGAWGVLTRGVVDRTRSFEIALANALAPFYNHEAYR
jgi:non-canonical (house-cleaning) NTP pyrophosphatase